MTSRILQCQTLMVRQFRIQASTTSLNCFFADLRQLSEQEVAEQLDSLQAQFAAVHSRTDYRSRLDAAHLSKEIQHVRHEKTRRKPASERVTILRTALVTKQARVLEAFRARRAADRFLMELKVEVESYRVSARHSRTRRSRS